jgi:hypothetical protein
MAQCAHCKAETSLYENGIPICLACCDKLDARRQEARESAIDEMVKRSTGSEAGTRSPHSDNNPEA